MNKKKLILINVSIGLVWISGLTISTDYILNLNIPYIDQTRIETGVSVIGGIIGSLLITILYTALLSIFGLLKIEYPKTEVIYHENDIYRSGVYDNTIAAKVRNQKQ